MKTNLLFFLGIFMVGAVQAQTDPEQTLESRLTEEAGEWEGEQVQENLAFFQKNPLDLNQADAETLSALGLLNPLQIASLLRYREMTGPFLNIYELQALPDWDIPLIRSLLPYITVTNNRKLGGTLRERLR